MQKYFAAFRRITLTGLLFLVPVYVVVIIAKQAWTSLNSMGTTLAKMFGVTDILGVGAPTVLSVALLILLCFVCGLIAHISVVAAVRSRMDGWLSTYIPGYAKHRVMVEEKLEGKVPTLPYASALIKQQDFWRPVYVVEQDAEGNCVVFAPNVPDTTTGSIMLARRHDVLLLPFLSANHLDASLKKRGVGLSSITDGGRTWPARVSS
ncbi:MAG TPA: hypothetical protein VMS40_05800 [Vicinamibacterales bacterium]|nr:hypothetical protein [Vicinamibacterales bacterium]